jgi:hypothetical protein
MSMAPHRRRCLRSSGTRSASSGERARRRLPDLADPQGRPRTEISAARPETLESNLLPVVLPPLVYSAPCTAGEDREVHETLREAYQYH